MSTDNILAPVAALTLPDATALTGRAQQAIAFATSFVITCQDDYVMAAEELQAIKTRQKALEEQRTGISGPLHKAMTAVNALFKGPADLLAEGERIWKGKLLGWQQEQERIAAEARRVAEAKAAAERKRLEDEAREQERIARAAAEQAQAAAAAGDHTTAELATANAQRAQAAAQTAVAEAQITTAAPPVVAPPKASGVSTSTTLDFEVVSLLDLARHIVEKQPELIGLLAADTTRLRAYVKGVGMACALGGVRVFPKQNISVRTA